MSSSSCNAEVTRLNPVVDLPVSPGTVEWVERLYRAGAVSMEPDGRIDFDPEVRKLISLIHTVLAGGKIETRVVVEGGNTFGQLEELFDRALTEAEHANMDKGHIPGAVVPYVP